MFSIKRSSLSKYMINSGINTYVGNNNYTDSKVGNIYNNSPDTTFQNFKTGDVFNLYENIVLNSKWDIRDNESGSTIILGRDHMFYEEVQDEKRKVDTYLKNENSNYFFSLINSPINLLNHSSKTLIDLGLTEGFDQTTEAILKNDFQNKEDNFENILNRNRIRKVSEVHYALSGYNLIYSEINVNEDIYNTISYNYENQKTLKHLFSGDKTVIVSLISETNSRFVKEISAEPPYYICNFLEDADNLNRNIEYFENMILKNLENSYTGKIFIKFNGDIEIGDVIVLVDNVNSINGMFRIDTYEHRFTRDGLVTVLNIKAYVNVTDPTVDVYAQSYLVKLHNDLKDEPNIDDNIAFSNIFSSIAKIMYQIPKYGMFYHKDESSLFNGDYPVKDNNARVNSLPIKFYPMIKKGRAYMPENIEDCFYATSSETQSCITAFLKNIANSVTSLFQDGREYAVGTLRYTLDFLVSIPTFSLHELLKPTLGIQYRKMMDTFDNTDFSDKQIDMLKDNENIYSGDLSLGNPTNYSNQEKNADYTVSFFNLKAQQEKGLFHFKNEEIALATPLDKLSEKIKIKEGISSAIAKNSCDTFFGVEVYSGFKIPRINYSYENYLSNVFNSNYQTFQIYENRYGKEFGVLFSNNMDKYNHHFRTPSYTIDIEPGRKAIVSTMNITDYNYLYRGEVDFLSGTGFTGGYTLKNIKFIWFHNYYGTDPGSIERRKTIFYNILENAKKMINDETGVIIIGDFNLHIDNYKLSDNLPASGTNQSLTITKEKDRFISCVNKPTTLSSTSGLKFVNKFDNALISDNLDFFYKDGAIKVNVNKYYIPTGLDRRDVSDHLPIYVTFKKRKY